MLKHLRTLFLCAGFLGFCAAPLFAQNEDNSPNQNRRSYEVVTHLLTSLDADSNAKLPGNLSGVEKKLKTNFPALNFRPIMTMLHRTSENSSLEYKGVAAFAQPKQTGTLPAFVEMSLKGISPKKTDALAVNVNGYLRFGLRIPLVSANLSDDKASTVFNYEQVGITSANLSFALDEPIIVGTLSTSRPNEILVLVLTVKPDAKN